MGSRNRPAGQSNVVGQCPGPNVFLLSVEPGSYVLMVSREKWMQAGWVLGAGSATLLVQALAAILGGPASYGMSFSEGVTELGYRPVWVISAWALYCVAVVTSILILGARSNEKPRKERAMRLLAASLWTCGAVSGPWFMIVNGAWGPLYDDHHGASHQGITLYVSQLATFWWLLSVPFLIAAGILSRILHVRSASAGSDDAGAAAGGE